MPKQNLTGGKVKLGNVSKQGDCYLRSLFTVGALAVIKYAKQHRTQHRPWLAKLLERRPTRVAAVALANKLARMEWAMMACRDRHAAGSRQRFQRSRSLRHGAFVARRGPGTRWTGLWRPIGTSSINSTKGYLKHVSFIVQARKRNEYGSLGNSMQSNDD